MGIRDYVPAKPMENKKMTFCVPCIMDDQILANLMPEFSGKKSSKDWESLVDSVKEAWAVAHEAMCGGNDSSTSKGKEDVDSILFFDNLNDDSPLERITSGRICLIIS